MAHIIIPDQDPKDQFAVAGSPQDTFSISFVFFEADGSDVNVYDGAELIAPNNYTITGTPGTEGGYDGGILVLDAAVTNTVITVELNMPIEREEDFPNSGPFNIQTLNTTLDKWAAIAQQLRAKINYGIQLPSTTNKGVVYFPDFQVGDANKVIIINATGDALAVGPTTTHLTLLASIADDIQTVADISVAVSNVSSLDAEILALYAIRTDISTDAAHAVEIAIVSAHIDNVDIAADNITDINIVAADIANVQIVAASIVGVDTVAACITDVNNVAADIAAIITCATDIAAIINAPQEAQDAEDSAALAESWAIDDIGSRPEGSAKYWAEQSLASAGGGMLKVSANDELAGYLNGKLVAGREIVFTENDGGDETLVVDTRSNKAPDILAGSGTQAADIADGIWHKITANGNFTFDLIFDSGKVQSMVIECVNWGAYTVTMPIALNTPSGQALSFTPSGTDHLLVYQDVDDALYASIIGKAVG